VNASLIKEAISLSLDDLVENALKRVSGEIEPVSRKAYQQGQNYIPGSEPKATERDFGEFFEVLAQGFFGGERKVSTRRFYSGSSYTDDRPDLVGKRFESDQKALGPGVSLKLRDKQVAMYHDRQLLYPHKRIGYQFFRHEVCDVLNDKSQDYTQADIFRMLSKNVSHGFDLSLSIVNAMMLRSLPNLTYRKFGPFVTNDEGKFVSREEIKKREESEEFKSMKRNAKGKIVTYHETPYTSIKANTFNALFYRPTDFIRALDLDPKMFSIKYVMSPSNMYVENKKVSQFPILQINDKSPVLWLNYFLRTFEPDNRFSDADMQVTDSICYIDKKYLSYVAKHHRNGDGYHHARPNGSIVHLPASAPALNEGIPF
jgi:hypothetical protein